MILSIFLYAYFLSVHFLIRYLFRSFAHLLIGLFVLIAKIKSSLCIFDTGPLSDMCLAKIFFSQSVSCTFIVLAVSPRAKIFNFYEVQIIHFFFHKLCFQYFISNLMNLKSTRFSSTLSSKSFIVSCGIFRSLIHFELTFMKCVKSMSKFFFFSVWKSSCFSHLLKRLFFPRQISFDPLLSSVDYVWLGQFLGFLFCSIPLFVLSPVSCSLDYCCCKQVFKFSNVSLLTFFLPFNILLAVLKCLSFHMNFRNSLSISIH